MRSLLILATAVAVVMVMSVGMVGADTHNETASDLEENVTEEISGEEYLEQVDSQVRLLEYDYSAGTFELRLENTEERPTSVTVTESIQFAEGAGSLSIQEERLLPGETTISIPVEARGGEAAVTLTTSESVSEGTGTFVSTGTSSGGSIFGGPSAWDYVWLSSGVVFVGTGYGVARYYRQADEPELGWRKP